MKIDTRNLIIYVCLVIGIILFIFNIFFIFSDFISLLSIAIVVGGPGLVEYFRYKERKDIEENFPDFLRDVSGNIKAGMTLPGAIKATRDNDYGYLSKHVKKIAIQIDWGVSFEKILDQFSKGEGRIIRRTIATITETHKGGGKIADIFDKVGKNINEINKIRKERMSTIHSQIITGYVIFFVFIGVLASLQLFLIPSLSVISSQVGLTSEELVVLYSNIFRWLIVIQGIFSGLVIGKMSEGRIVAGLKHSIILTVVGYGILVFL